MFALTNARGETVDINNDKLLSYTPTGLGVQFTNTYSQYETYFKATKSTVTQGQFQIYILFGDVESQAYQTFSDFAQFLAYQPLTLTYTTDSGTWYRDGRLNSLTKTEIGGSTVFATDRINESFTLEFINNWYNNKSAEYKSYDPDPNLATYGKIYGNQIADTSIQINSQGQQNKLVNTEFSPDLSGWRSSNATDYLSYIDIDDFYKGSRVVHYNGGKSGRLDFQSQMIPISDPNQTFSFSVWVKGRVYVMVEGFKTINETSTGSSWTDGTYWSDNYKDWTLLKITKKTLNQGDIGTAKYISFTLASNGTEFWAAQPMLVFDTTVGDYVQGLEYNHVATPAYTYDYAPYYVYKESTTNAGEKMMPLVNDSKYFGVQQGSPCIVTITGATTNPHWNVLQDGVTVSTDGFTLTLADNQRLIVSSYPEDQYARVYNPDGSFADVSQLQDFTMTNFVQIPEGESTVLVYVDKDTGVNLTFKEERLLV